MLFFLFLFFFCSDVETEDLLAGVLSLIVRNGSSRDLQDSMQVITDVAIGLQCHTNHSPALRRALVETFLAIKTFSQLSYVDEDIEQFHEALNFLEDEAVTEVASEWLVAKLREEHVQHDRQTSRPHKKRKIGPDSLQQVDQDTEMSEVQDEAGSEEFPLLHQVYSRFTDVCREYPTDQTGNLVDARSLVRILSAVEWVENRERIVENVREVLLHLVARILFDTTPQVGPIISHFPDPPTKTSFFSPFLRRFLMLQNDQKVFQEYTNAVAMIETVLTSPTFNPRSLSFGLAYRGLSDCCLLALSLPWFQEGPLNLPYFERTIAATQRVTEDFMNHHDNLLTAGQSELLKVLIKFVAGELGGHPHLLPKRDWKFPPSLAGLLDAKPPSLRVLACLVQRASSPASSWISEILDSSTGPDAPVDVRIAAFSLLPNLSHSFTAGAASRQDQSRRTTPNFVALLARGVGDPNPGVGLAVARACGLLVCGTLGCGTRDHSAGDIGCALCDPPVSPLSRDHPKTVAEFWVPFLPFLASQQPLEIRVTMARSLRRILAHTGPQDPNYEVLVDICFELLSVECSPVRRELGCASPFPLPVTKTGSEYLLSSPLFSLLISKTGRETRQQSSPQSPGDGLGKRFVETLKWHLSTQPHEDHLDLIGHVGA